MKFNLNHFNIYVSYLADVYMIMYENEMLFGLMRTNPLIQ